MIRTVLLGLAVAAAAAGQTRLLDLVLLLEDTRGMGQESSNTRLPLKSGDQVAVVGFSTKIKVRQKFTAGARKIDRVIRRIGGSRLGAAGTSFGQRKQPSGVHLYEAIVEACALLRPLPADPGRKRAIVLLFGADNIGPVPGFEDARKALERAQATLFASAVRKFELPVWHDPKLRTPPTIPGGSGSGPKLAPLPDASIPAIRELAQKSGGDIVVGRWDLPEVLARLR